MGIFSGIKNYLTGSGSEVSLDPFIIQLGGEARPARVNIKVKENDIKSKEVYLRLRCTYICHEHELEWKDTNNDQMADQLKVRSEKVTGSVKFEKITMDSASSYPKNSELSFEHSISLGNEYLPFITEKVEWAAMAGIDTSGNDPDSDWMEIFVNNPNAHPKINKTSLEWKHTIGDKAYTIKFNLEIAFGFDNEEELFREHKIMKDEFSNEKIQDSFTQYFKLQFFAKIKDVLPTEQSPKLSFSGFELFNDIRKELHTSAIKLWYLDITSIEVIEKK